MYIVSECLYGHNCKYNGGNNLNSKVVEFLKDKNFCLVCPESMGGLDNPRPPAERIGSKVIDKEGNDLTNEFNNGANFALNTAISKSEELGEKIEGAILKSKSPSCGYKKIYDGTFTSVLVDGNGVFANLLLENNIKIATEKEIVND